MLELTGATLQDKRTGSFWNGHLDYLEVIETFDVVSDEIEQSVEDFILCQHSRATFAISKLGDRRARFDTELRELLMPHANRNGGLKFRTFTKLTAATVQGA